MSKFQQNKLDTSQPSSPISSSPTIPFPGTRKLFNNLLSVRNKKHGKNEKRDGDASKPHDSLVKHREPIVGGCIHLSASSESIRSDEYSGSKVASLPYDKERSKHPKTKPPLPPKQRSLLKLPGSESSLHDNAAEDEADANTAVDTPSGSEASFDAGRLTRNDFHPVIAFPKNNSVRKKERMFSLGRGRSSEDDTGTLKVRDHVKTNSKCKKSLNVKYVRVHGEAEKAYKNETEPRGLIFIKNVEHFKANAYEQRTGSRKDYFDLLELFEQMGYLKKSKYCDTGTITKSKFMKDLKDFSQHNHDRYDSSVIVIMSHGIRDKTFVTSDNEEIDLMEVYEMFNNVNCSSLKDKPKIFILQFCRPKSDLPMSPSCANLSPLNSSLIEDIVEKKVAMHVQNAKIQIMSDLQKQIQAYFEQVNPGNNSGSSTIRKKSSVTSPPPIEIDYMDDESDTTSCTSEHFRFEYQDSKYLSLDASGFGRVSSLCPLDPASTYSDMYSIFSTNSGGVAYRSRKHGSLLVQAICSVFSRHAFQDDIEELVRKVSKHMQRQLAREDPLMVQGQAVVERVNNGLDKAFYFNPYPMKINQRRFTIK